MPLLVPSEEMLQRDCIVVNISVPAISLFKIVKATNRAHAGNGWKGKGHKTYYEHMSLVAVRFLEPTFTMYLYGFCYLAQYIFPFLSIVGLSYDLPFFFFFGQLSVPGYGLNEMSFLNFLQPAFVLCNVPVNCLHCDFFVLSVADTWFNT